MFSIKRSLAVFTGLLMLICLTVPALRTGAADHRDGPVITDIGTHYDIDDVYFFLDPSDNSRAVIAFDVAGPIIPPENAAAGFFAPGVNYRLQIENTGDAVGDKFIDITFSKQAAPDRPQLATVTFSAPQTTWRTLPASFSAPTTLSSSTAEEAPAPVVTVDRATGIAMFAGLVEDPFFANLPGLSRYLDSRRAGRADESLLAGGRDSFAGYNVLMVALSIPVSHLRGPAGDLVGLSVYAQSPQMTKSWPDSDPTYSGKFMSVDRMGNPGVNTTFISYQLKDDYNRATTTDDAAGRFAAEIAGTLRALGTDEVSINIILNQAARRGDMLRLNLNIPNAGQGGGNNAQAAFPNGRRPGDDVIDTMVTIINNRVALGDNVNGNDVTFRSVFPFFAGPHQPSSANSIGLTKRWAGLFG